MQFTSSEVAPLPLPHSEYRNERPLTSDLSKVAAAKQTCLLLTFAPCKSRGKQIKCAGWDRFHLGSNREGSFHAREAGGAEPACFSGTDGISQCAAVAWSIGGISHDPVHHLSISIRVTCVRARSLTKAAEGLNIPRYIHLPSSPFALTN